MKNIHERQDFFFKKAKKEGYPARSVYKLQEIDNKYRLIKSGNFVLDLGCAPGSWLMYIAGKIGPVGKVWGVDLLGIRVGLSSNAKFIEKNINDLTSDDFNNVNFNLIVSDMAPNTTGIKSRDTDMSLRLVLTAFEIVKQHLKPKGHFLFKIFESKEAHDLMKDLRKYFEIVKRHDANASRKTSKEFYVVCKSYLGAKS